MVGSYDHTERLWMICNTCKQGLKLHNNKSLHHNIICTSHIKHVALLLGQQWLYHGLLGPTFTCYFRNLGREQ